MTFRKQNAKLLFESPSVSSGEETELKRFDFEFERKMGDGAFGQVWRVRHKTTNQVFALKQVPKEKVSKMLTQFRREVYIMYEINHPHIVKLYNHFEDDKFFYLIMELAEGNLFHKLYREKHFLEKNAAQYFREVLLAVEYLHSHVPSIIHRDIKPENILLDKEGRLKLTDFGWSNFYSSDVPTPRFTTCGTLEYLPPEMVQEKGHDTSADIWCLGILLYEILIGMTPFKSSLREQMLINITSSKPKFPLSTPQLAKDLISKMLEKDPSKRLTAAQIKDHPWMKEFNPIRPTITQDLQPKVIPELDSPKVKSGYLVINKDTKAPSKKGSNISVEIEENIANGLNVYRQSIKIMKDELEVKSKEMTDTRKALQEKSLTVQKLEEEVKRLEFRVNGKKKELAKLGLAEKDTQMQLADISLDLEKVIKFYKNSDLSLKIEEKSIETMEKTRECRRLQSYLQTMKEEVRTIYQNHSEKEKNLSSLQNKLKSLKLDILNKSEEKKKKISDKKTSQQVLKTQLVNHEKVSRVFGKDELKIVEEIKKTIQDLVQTRKNFANLEDLVFQTQENIIQKEQTLNQLLSDYEEKKSLILQQHRKNKEELFKEIKSRKCIDEIKEREKNSKAAENLRNLISDSRKAALHYDVNSSEIHKLKIGIQEMITKVHIVNGRLETAQTLRNDNKRIFNNNSFKIEQIELHIGFMKSALFANDLNHFV
jgi:serine/threonine protein kinase